MEVQIPTITENQLGSQTCSPNPSIRHISDVVQGGGRQQGSLSLVDRKSRREHLLLPGQPPSQEEDELKRICTINLITNYNSSKFLRRGCSMYHQDS